MKRVKPQPEPEVLGKVYSDDSNHHSRDDATGDNVMLYFPCAQVSTRGSGLMVPNLG